VLLLNDADLSIQDQRLPLQLFDLRFSGTPAVWSTRTASSEPIKRQLLRAEGAQPLRSHASYPPGYHQSQSRKGQHVFSDKMDKNRGSQSKPLSHPIYQNRQPPPSLQSHAKDNLCPVGNDSVSPQPSAQPHQRLGCRECSTPPASN